MARGKAAGESKKRKEEEEEQEEAEEQSGPEADDDSAGANEGDKENQQPDEDDDEEAEEGDDEKVGQRQQRQEEDEADEGTESAGASRGKRKKASSDASPNKKAKASDAHSVLLAYMQRMNRPYSAINVADNQKGALSKSQTTKVLDDLTNDGKVTAKEFGKSRVYWVTQDAQDASPDDMARLDRQMAELTEQLNKARTAAAALQAEVSTATAEPDDEALEAELAGLEKSVPAAEKRLAAMKGGKDAMPAADEDALQRQFNVYLGEWKKRKRGCKELVGLVAQNAAKSWKEKSFLEDQGIETDEMVKVKLEEWQTYFRDVKPLPPKEVKGKAKKK